MIVAEAAIQLGIGLFGLWMPLRDVNMAYWALLGALLVVHTILNTTGHFERA